MLHIYHQPEKLLLEVANFSKKGLSFGGGGGVRVLLSCRTESQVWFCGLSGGGGQVAPS